MYLVICDLCFPEFMYNDILPEIGIDQLNFNRKQIIYKKCCKTFQLLENFKTFERFSTTK